jgi:hypothetical protein
MPMALIDSRYSAWVVLKEAVGVLAEAAVGGAPRGLHVRHVPRLGAERVQKRLRGHGAGADLEIVGLGDDAALLRPVVLQREDQILEVHGGGTIQRQPPK